MNYKRILKSYVLHFTFCILIFIPLLALAGVKGTKHDLSFSGPGPVKAVSETQICIFCHTPHNADPAYPLWNHELSSVENYINYWSDTLKTYSSEAEAPSIDGFSKLCLSCHDGTVAVGAIVGSLREYIEIVTVLDVVEAGKLVLGAAGYLGTNLSGGHPISFIFDQALADRRNHPEPGQPELMHLNWPIIDPDVRLYSTQGGYGVQCTSCHDPHGGKGGRPSAPPFWRKTNHDDVCLVCHEEIITKPPIKW